MLSIIWESSVYLCVSLDTTLLPLSKLFIIYKYSFSLVKLFSKATFRSLSVSSSSNVSILIMGWLGNRISLHLSANNRVEYVSYIFSSDISSVQITDILLRPVKESLRILVSFDDRYGTNLSELFYASAEMTFPRELKEVLMNLASSRRRSTELDFLTLSEPAKSIKDKVDDRYSVLDIFCVT